MGEEAGIKSFWLGWPLFGASVKIAGLLGSFLENKRTP